MLQIPTMEQVYQILTPEGEVVGAIPDLPDEQLVSYYRWMMFGRAFSDRLVALQRQGRIGTFAPINGQEAASVGLAAPLRPKDWLVGSYRETLSYLLKGLPPLAVMEMWRGYITSRYSRELCCLPLQVVLATQMHHAVGIAMALKYEGKPDVVVAVCGDGATSEGDFNEALNFAAVFKAPVIFVVQNNGWAISVPRQRQTAAEYIAARGAGFGLPGYVVDGNDLLAVYQVVADALDRARAGDGPTLIEAITYRLCAHTTADDPTKYRSEAEVQAWAKRDPLRRFYKFLLDRYILDERDNQRLCEEVTAEIQEIVETYEALPPQDPGQLLELVYADMPPQLQLQRQRLDLAVTV
jgi:pyruvate dehydrogenase E1 component alpha subunit